MPICQYTVGLTEKTKQRAKDELNEVESEISSHIETLRNWVKSRPHIICRTDDEFLLRFLRIAKYSQLKAQERLDHYCTIKSSEKEGCSMFYENFNPMDESIIQIMDLGYIYRLPGYDDEGRIWCISDEGAYDPKTVNLVDVFRAALMSTEVIIMDPMAQINGVCTVSDFTNFNSSHMLLMTNDVMRKSAKIWEGCLPVRNKAMHMWNTGPIFNTVMEVCRLFMSKKLLSRFYVHGQNLENLKKAVPLKMLPNELGGTAGSRKELIESWKQTVMKHRHELQALDEIKIDESKRVKDDVVGSFRKLNVD